MGDQNLLLGWPLTAPGFANRPFASRRRRRDLSDLRKAEQYRKDGHLITLAPTGAGKGVRVIIPNLLHYTGPVIVIDPKGENFAVTARYRSEVLGQRIFLLDPFEVVPQFVLESLRVQRASLNPLDFMVARGELGPQLTMMASIFSTKSGVGDFWDQSAQLLLAGTLGAAVGSAQTEKKPVSFQKFIDYLTSDDVTYNLAVTIDTIGSKIDKVSYKALSNFLQRAEKERSGVLSTALSYLTPFTSESVNKHLDTSTILPRMIVGDDDYTIYIVIPPSKLTSHALLTRLWVSTLLNAIMERGEKPLKRTLFLLDECAQLGKLDALSKAVTLLRGYGLQVWMFFQDMSQLQSNYQNEATTILNNCGVLQAFGVPRQSAGAPIADTVGRFEPMDLVQIDKTQQVLSLSNESPKLCRLMNYIEDNAFKHPQRRFDDNPLFIKHRPEIHSDDGFPSNSFRIHI